MLTIFVGDTGLKTAEYVRSLHPQAQLITDQNFTDITGVGYTSLGEFQSYKNFFNLLDKADQLHYVACNPWSDSRDGVSSLQDTTENILMFFYGRKPVHGLDHLQYHNNKRDSLVAARSTQATQLWVVGGTVTYAEELDIEYKYGSVLSNMLDMPVCYISKNNATINWCADQVLRSDIRCGDVAIWELTQSDNIDQSLILIDQCISVFSRVHAKLIFVGLEDMNMLKYFFNLPNYLHLYGQFGTFFKAFPDKDSSTLWPGPMTHKWYANEIHKKFFI